MATFVTSSEERAEEFVWSDVRMVTDDPAKRLGKLSGEGLLINQIDEVLESPARSVVLVSPYFVPGEMGTRVFASLNGNTATSGPRSSAALSEVCARRS